MEISGDLILVTGNSQEIPGNFLGTEFLTKFIQNMINFCKIRNSREIHFKTEFSEILDNLIIIIEIIDTIIDLRGGITDFIKNFKGSDRL